MVKFILYPAYDEILATTDVVLTSYEINTKLKYLLYDMFEFLLDSFSPSGGWDFLTIRSLANIHGFVRLRDDVVCEWGRVLRRSLCKELSVPAEGYRLAYRINGEFLLYRRLKVL